MFRGRQRCQGSLIDSRYFIFDLHMVSFFTKNYPDIKQKRGFHFFVIKNDSTICFYARLLIFKIGTYQEPHIVIDVNS